MRHCTIAALVLAAAMFAGGAGAATVTLDRSGGTVFGHPNLSRPVFYTINGQAGRSRAGMFRLLNSDTGAEVLAWCVDLFHPLRTPGIYELAQFLSTQVEDNIDRLFTAFYDQIDTAEEAAGFQLALWEIVSDTGQGLGLDDGAFTARGGAARYDYARDYLDALPGAGMGGFALSYLNATEGGQDLVSASRVRASSVPAAVPVPAGVYLLGFGLAGLAGLARRRKPA